MASMEEEAAANRERWHWQEVDLSEWVKRWLQVNVEEVVLVETMAHKVRCCESYKDSGECVVHCRKGE